MSGGAGARFWNDETQRWEDGDGTAPAATSPVTPPPARPDAPPAWPPVASPRVSSEVPAKDSDGTSGVGAVSDPDGWPGAGGQGNGWHGPAAGAGEGAGGWSETQVMAAGAAGGTRPPDTAPWPGHGWPPAGDQGAGSPPARATNRRRVWSVVGGVAAVGVTVGLVLTLVVDSGDGDGEGASAAVSASPTVPSDQVPGGGDPYASQTTPEVSASPSPTAPELPAGYQSYEDSEGFRIAIPEGWSRSQVDSQYGIAVVNYRNADSTRRLQVYQVAEESPDASFELYLSDETKKADGFEQLLLQNLDDGEFTGSRLEYLADSISGEPDIGTWHVYDERFVAQDGNIYAIAAYGPDADGRDDELELLTTALDAFCPPYACDPASVD